MDIAAMLEPAPYATMSSCVLSPTQQRPPSSIFAISQPHQKEQQQQQYHAPRPLSALPPLSSLPPPPPPIPQQPQVHRINSESSAAPFVHVPIHQRPLPTQHHRRQHSNDNARRGSSTSSSAAGPRHRGKQTKAACIPCRKRKSKCDGIRPSCQSCAGRVTACEYSVDPGVTQQQAVKNQLDAYKHILNLLRQGSAAECQVLIEQLKAHEHLVDAVGNIMQERIIGDGSE